MNTTTKKTEREQFLDDVITTALEGGIGYWSMCETYTWGDDKPTVATIFQTEEDITCRVCGQSLRDARSVTEQLWRAPVILATDAEIETITETDDGRTIVLDCEHQPEVLTVDRALIEKAIATLLAGPVKFMSDKWRARLIGASAINDAGDIDASDADAIVQVGLFGEVVYG